ncbi:MAG: integration host factor subunit alpha [Proteobacteria bacterium]|nr:integration host factor subunit alpha [Desulfobulbaceae bacterium]MBU4152232.1 integration host factor subunit alpha [Pseudomonadota bacterium]MDP2106446.1 integration host factor subunit alpha [Desulfobulbaceae bacterium]
MSADNVTRRHLSNAIYDQVGFSKQISGDIVDAFFDQIKEALLSEENVKLVQFGSFKLRKKTSRIGRNPKTGETIEITSRSMVSFKPSKSLRDRINRSI